MQIFSMFFFPKRAFNFSVMLFSGEAIRRVGRKPLKTSSRERERERETLERVTETEDFYYQRGFF